MKAQAKTARSTTAAQSPAPRKPQTEAESLPLHKLLELLHEAVDHCESMQAAIHTACIPVTGAIEFGPTGSAYLEFPETYSETHRILTAAVNRLRTLLDTQTSVHVALVKNL